MAAANALGRGLPELPGGASGRTVIAAGADEDVLAEAAARFRSSPSSPRLGTRAHLVKI
jgi:hypothetical protein